MASPDPADARRRLRAKRQNERIKLAAGFLNTTGLAIIGTAFIVPIVNGADAVRWPWIPFGLALHLSAQGLLSFLRSED